MATNEEKEAILLRAIRELVNDPKHAKATAKLQGLPDDELLDLFFKINRSTHQYRTTSLTRFGVKILRQCFDSWEIKLNTPLTARQHLLLSRECQLPYYLDQDCFITFEASVGIILKVAEGNNKYIEQMFAH